MWGVSIGSFDFEIFVIASCGAVVHFEQKMSYFVIADLLIFRADPDILKNKQDQETILQRQLHFFYEYSTI